MKKETKKKKNILRQFWGITESCCGFLHFQEYVGYHHRFEPFEMPTAR